MCGFFSFVQEKNGDIHYFNAKERGEIYSKGQVTVEGAVIKGISNPDSHDSIIRAFLSKTDRSSKIYDSVNKYEVDVDVETGDPVLQHDCIVHQKVVSRALQWMEGFCKSGDFLKLCKVEIKKVADAEAAAAFIFKHSKATAADIENVIGYDINVLKYANEIKLSEAIQENIMLNWDDLSEFGCRKVTPFLTSKRAAVRAFEKGKPGMFIPRKLISDKIIRIADNLPPIQLFRRLSMIPKDMLTDKMKSAIIDGHYNDHGEWRDVSRPKTAP